MKSLIRACTLTGMLSLASAFLKEDLEAVKPKMITVPLQKEKTLEVVTPLHQMMKEDRLKDYYAMRGEHALRMAESGDEEGAQLLGATYDTSLTNEYNLLLVGPMYFGQPLQTPDVSRFVYDTGKNELSTTSTHCLVCSEKTKYYNSTASSNYVKKSSKINALIYGLTVLNG